MAAEIDPLIRTSVSRIQKVEWLAAFVAAHDRAVCTRNILAGFRGTGIHPFLLSKVLNRITSASDTQIVTRPTTPSNTAPPFHESVLTSSPIDIFAVNRPNSALAAELDSGKPLSSSAKKFIKCQGRSVERLYASNSILKYDNTVKDAVVSARKRRLSGKRKEINGKHIISAEELVAIQKAEEMTKQKKVPTRRVAG